MDTALFLAQTRPFEINELTDQEKRILSLLARGFNNQTITEALYISKNTLKTHTRNIYSKLEVSDRTQAALWAVKRGYDKRGT